MIGALLLLGVLGQVPAPPVPRPPVAGAQRGRLSAAKSSGVELSPAEKLEAEERARGLAAEARVERELGLLPSREGDEALKGELRARKSRRVLHRPQRFYYGSRGVYRLDGDRWVPLIRIR